jgi:hypothetical protein
VCRAGRHVQAGMCVVRHVCREESALRRWLLTIYIHIYTYMYVCVYARMYVCEESALRRWLLTAYQPLQLLVPASSAISTSLFSYSYQPLQLLVPASSAISTSLFSY